MTISSYQILYFIENIKYLANTYHQNEVPECNIEECNTPECTSGIKAVYYSPCKQMCDNLSKKCSIYSNMRDLLRNHCPKSSDKESFRGFDCPSFAREYFPKYDETDPVTGEWLGDLRCLLEPTSLPTTTTARPQTQTTTFRFFPQTPTRDPFRQLTTPRRTAPSRRQTTTAQSPTTVPIVTVTKTPPICPGINGKKPTLKEPNKPCPKVQTGRAQFVSYKGMVHNIKVI